MTLRIMPAITFPVSTAELTMGIERKRSIAPLVMSSHTLDETEAEPKPAHSRMIPGTT